MNDDGIITSPDGRVQYRIGERVGTQCDYPYAERVISEYHDGSWEPAASVDETAWFVFEDGSMAKPFVLIKLPVGSEVSDSNQDPEDFEFDQWCFTARDETRILDGAPVPVITTVLYRVCEGNHDRFEEAMRILKIAFQAGRSLGEQIE